MSAEAPSGAGMLSARGLRLARLAWLALLLFGLVLVVLSLPGQYQLFQTVCGGAGCDSRQLSPSQAAELSRLGLSMPGLAAYFTGLSLLQGLVFVLVGAIIFWRKPGDRPALIMSFALVAFGLGSLLSPSSRLPVLVQFLMALLMALGNSGIVLFFFLFPDGHFFPRWTRWLALAAVAREVGAVFFPNSVFDPLFPFVVVAILVLQVFRYWRGSNAVQRQQTKWVVFGTLSALGLYTGLLLSYGGLSARGVSFGVVPVIALSTVIGLSLALIPISIAIAILRSRLWDIDLLIRGTLVYGALTLLLAAVYFAVVIGLQAIVTALTGQSRSELVTVLSTLAIAALFVPLRRRVQAAIDRRFYRRKYDAARILAEFGLTLRDEVNLDELKRRLLTVVDETMQPASVGLLLVADDRK